jgi:DNA polymerase-3 subunit alpha
LTEEWSFQKYVPLHVHTDSSILDGYQKPYEYADLCEKLHVKAAAVTDHGTCSGQEPFDRRIIEKGYHFKPIFGEEAYLVDDVDNVMSDRPARDRKGNIKINKETGEPEMAKQRPSDFNHGCIWAKTNEGLANLWTLSTLSYTKGMYYKPRIDMKMLKQYGKGLFVSDGCMLSAVSRGIVADDFSKAEAWLNKLIEAVGKDNVLMELHTWQFTDEKYSKDWKTFEHDELKDLIRRLRACDIVLKSMEDLDNARKEVESFGRSLTDEQKKQKAAFAQYDAEINNWNLNQNMYKTNKGKVELARKLGLRLIAVNDAHYGPREDYIWHELEWATTTGKGAEYDDDKTGGRGETAAWVMNDEEVKYWLMKSGLSEEIADEAIDNTGWVADHCNAVMERGMHPPRFESTREKDEELFDKTVVEGIKELVPKDRNTFKQYMDRVNLESELIKKCDLCGYFNTVADYANFVRAEDPDGEKYGIVGKHASLLGPGRGSAGSSIVCYLMHITNLDPIKFNLFFERFLTAGRVISKVHLTFDDGEEKVFEPSDVVKTEYGDKASWQCLTENWNTEFGKIVSTRFDFKDCPDIDLDFEARVIPQLNAYLKKRYGEYNFCQIGTFQTLKMPMAVKDLGKVKGMTPQETQDIVNRMENAGWPKGAYMRDYTFEDMMNCVNKDEELKKIQEETGLFDEVWHWGERYRGEGIHASGYVISKESMLGKLPLRMKDGKLITQFEHDGIASLGFIKYDILKLAGLGTIREVYERVNHKMDVKDIYRIMRDEKLLANVDMWKSTWTGDTLGIFQMDTPLGMKTAINSKMASLRDAGMLSAVDRPGMVRSGLINEFYKVRQGIDPVNHYHPLIDSILDETSGFCVYQEQIMKIYATLCDMKIEETDNVRKVFTKKQTWNVEKMKTLLHDCCMSRKDFIDNVPSKYDSPEACFDDIWVGLSRTAEYCFNASHANAYGMITSIEQYFKWKYPSEFITASLNTDPGAVEFLTYAKVHGLKIAPPNVNKSKQNYELQDSVIYMPLSTVKGVGPAAVDEIIANGPYDSFDDYVQKTSGRGGRKKNVMESLISVGAFDGVDERDRFQLMVDWKKSRNEDYPTRNTWKSPRIRGKIEQNLLGISLSYDPLFDNKEWIEKQGVASLGELQKADVGDFVCIPGQVTSIRKHQAKNGEMAWLTVKLLSHDEVTLTMFATAWSKYKDLISTNVIAAFNCKRTDDWNGKQSYVAFSAKANLEGEE